MDILQVMEGIQKKYKQYRNDRLMKVDNLCITCTVAHCNNLAIVVSNHSISQFVKAFLHQIFVLCSNFLEQNPKFDNLNP